MCDGKKVICSNSSDVNIPQEFCKDIFNCECVLPSDCGNGCECISSTCNPSNGSRKTTTIKVKKPQKLLIIVSVICLITFPLIFYFLYRDYHLNINKKIVIPVIVVISLLPLAYTIIVSNKNYEQKIYEKSCEYIPPPGCIEDTLCANGQICKSGKCEYCTISSECKGKICDLEGFCTPCSKNIDCEGKICDASGMCVSCTDETCLNGMYCKDSFCYAMTVFICNKKNTSDIDIYLSYDNIKYFSFSYDNHVKQINSLFYNGSYWLAICDKNDDNYPDNTGMLYIINSTEIEKSNLVEIPTGLNHSLGIGILYDLAWNKNKKIWVAVGAWGTRGSGSKDQIYVSSSTDISTWRRVDYDFSGYGTKVECNNDYFLILGKGMYPMMSYDGETTTKKIDSPFFNDLDIRGFLWNEAQKKWVMFGENANGFNIIYSTYSDGSMWIGGDQKIFTNVTSVACNDDIWIAVGEKKNGPGYGMAYSDNGITWYPNEQDIGNHIIWNGNVFIAMGYSNSKSIIYYSSEGTKWTKLDMTMFESKIDSIATSFIADQ
jgi:hypothetical protein